MIDYVLYNNFLEALVYKVILGYRSDYKLYHLLVLKLKNKMNYLYNPFATNLIVEKIFNKDL